MIAKIKRATFNKVIGVAELRRAFAFAILLKDRKPASVIKGWSYSMLSEITGCSRATCKKRIAALRKLGLVSEGVINGVRYLYLLPLRARSIEAKSGRWFSPQKQDIDIKKIDRTSVGTIEKGLCALLVVEIQTRKNFVRQVISSKGKSKDPKKIKRAQRLCRDRGWENYSEQGISYDGIARRLGCGRNTAIKIVAHGEGQKMFFKQKLSLKHLHIPYGRGMEAFLAIEGWHWATRNNLYRQPSNQYTILQ